MENSKRATQPSMDFANVRLQFPPPAGKIQSRRAQHQSVNTEQPAKFQTKVDPKANMNTTPRTTQSNAALASSGGSVTALFNFTTKQHLPVLIPSLFASIVMGCVVPVQAYLMGKVFTNFSNWGAGQISNHEFDSKLLTLILWFIGLGAVSWFLSSLLYAGWNIFGDMQARSAREKILDALLDRDIEWFDQRKDGVAALTARLQGLVYDLQTSTGQPIGMIVRDFATTLASLGMALYMSWKLTLVIVSTLPLLAIIVPFVSSRIQPNIELQIAKLTEAAKYAMNAFSVIETVKCYNGQKAELWMYSHLLHQSAACYTRQVNWNALQASILRFFTLAMFVQGFWYGTSLVDKNSNSLGNILTAFWSCIMATGAIMQLVPQLIILEKGKVAGRRLRSIMAAMSAASTQCQATYHYPKTCAGDLMLSNVSFAYPSRPQQMALHGASLFFAAGDLTFVIGKSGSGKSTIGQLLSQFYHPTQGDISLDQVSLETIDPQWLRTNILLVEQQSVLFNTTLRENIALGRRGKETATLGDINSASEFASIRKTIESLPHGFETMVGTKGGSLSGGQRQRVAIARAKLRDPPILILDESTSALDYINRIAVLAAIRKWRSGRTTIIITHDISQILPDDFVYVLKEGQVVQEGFRKALAEAEGYFQEFMNQPEDVAPRKQSNINKSLPSIPADPDTSSVHSSNNLMSEINPNIVSPEDSLFHFFEEGQNRASVFIPTVFTNRLGIAPTRDSMRLPPVVAPFWSVMPVPARVAPVRELEEARRLSIGRDSEGRHSMVIDGTITKTLGRSGSRLSNIALRRLSGSATPRRARPFSKEPIQMTREESSIHCATARGNDDLENPSIDETVKKDIKVYTMKKILLTIWPSFDWAERSCLIVGILATLAYAASTPVFSFIFSKLLATLFIPADRKKKAFTYSLAILGVAIGDGIFIFLQNTQLQNLAQLWVNKIRFQAMERILDQPREFFDDEKNGMSQMVECLDHHAEEMQHILGRFCPIILTVVVMIGMAVIWSFVTCWKLTFVLVACTPILFGIMQALSRIGSVMETASLDASEFSGTIFTETFVNIKTVRSLTLEGHFREKYRSACENTLKIGIRKGFYVGVFFGLSQAILLFVVALIFYYGGVLLSSKQFSLTDILQVFTLLLLSISTATMILASMPQLSGALEAAARLLRLANLPTDSHEHVGNARVPHLGDITFHDVTFRYPTRPDALVLDGVNFSIPAGSCVALVGTSGSGKSTIAALLLNLYRTGSKRLEDLNPAPDITFTGRDIRRIHTPTLRNLIAIVSQTPTLFPVSVSANIVYGLRRGDPLNTAINVRSAAEAAGIHEFISSLPLGYDTIIGDGGMGLSGGQAQRIAIARAIARRPNVLILDEATSALDVESANVVRESVQNLLDQDRRHGGRNMTVIIITHSKDMMKMAERIIMMEKGVVVEDGPFEELIRRNGEFARMLRGEAWKVDTQKQKRRSMMLMSKTKGVA